MTRKRKVVIVLLAVAAAGIVGELLVSFVRGTRPVVLRGAVLVRDTDVDKQAPIADVRVSVAGGLASQDARSSSTGFFELTLLKQVKSTQPIILQFRHPQYMPLDLTLLAGDRLTVARLMPLSEFSLAVSNPPPTEISNVKIRYTEQSATLLNVGSLVKTFHVFNTSNVLCKRRFPCSPDEKWKASIGSERVEAPRGNVFANARVSCIAGPCAFTRIRSDGFSRGGPTLSVEVLDWSSSATFLIEAEVYRSMLSDNVRISYPVIFGQTLHFTVPPDAQGACIEADLNSRPIVFPLGPEPLLDWASCTQGVSPNHAEIYQCDLKSGYAFK